MCAATFLSSASRPSLTRHTVLPPAEERTVTVASTKSPRLARCFFVFSSATIFTIRTSCPIGAKISGITISFPPLSTALFAYANYSSKKLFALANCHHYITSQEYCQWFECTIFKFSAQNFSFMRKTIRSGRYRPVLQGQNSLVRCHISCTASDVIWRDRGSRRRPLPRS